MICSHCGAKRRRRSSAFVCGTAVDGSVRGAACLTTELTRVRLELEETQLLLKRSGVVNARLVEQLRTGQDPGLGILLRAVRDGGDPAQALAEYQATRLTSESVAPPL